MLVPLLQRIHKGSVTIVTIIPSLRHDAVWSLSLAFDSPALHNEESTGIVDKNEMISSFVCITIILLIKLNF